MINGIANTFIIGKNKKGRSISFFERVKTKSFVNYYIKTALIMAYFRDWALQGAKDKQRKYLKNYPWCETNSNKFVFVILIMYDLQ